MQALALSIFRALLKGTKRATSFSFIKSSSSAAAQVGILLKELLPTAPKAWCQHFHYQLSHRSNQKQSFTHIFNLSNAPFPPSKAHKKAVLMLVSNYFRFRHTSVTRPLPLTTKLLSMLKAWMKNYVLLTLPNEEPRPSFWCCSSNSNFSKYHRSFNTPTCPKTSTAF